MCSSKMATPERMRPCLERYEDVCVCVSVIGAEEGGSEAITTLSHLIFNHVTCLTGLLQVWPTFENVIVNTSLDWDEQTRVGNCLMYLNK